MLSRRTFLAGTSLLAAGLSHGAAQSAEGKRLPRVAAINSIYRLRSHAYHIAGRFIYGYRREGVQHQPPFELVSMYNDQSPPEDLGPDVCRKHGVKLSKSVADALGGKSLDVDAVLLIAEHGDYPVNEYGQILYPRFAMFEQIVDVFKSAGRSVPVFVDKHLSYDHRQAAKMVQTARAMKFGLMAGSSLPVTWRRPELDPPLQTPLREGLVCFGFDRGPAEVYFFHALEALQCLLERRVGGETGVKQVTGLEGDAVWKAGDAGLWSWSLLDAAVRHNPSRNYGEIREQVQRPQALLVEYSDGTRGAVLNLVEAVSELSFAGRVEGKTEPLATSFVLPAPPGAKFFDALVENIEKFFTTGQSPYPVERTLLTSTILDLGLRSLHSQQPIADEALDIDYTAPSDDGHMRRKFTDA